MNDQEMAALLSEMANSSSSMPKQVICTGLASQTSAAELLTNAFQDAVSKLHHY